MENRDFLLQLAIRSDDKVLDLLSQTPLMIPLYSIMKTQYFWYLRTQHLVDHDLRQRPGENWRQAYYGLRDCRYPDGKLKFNRGTLVVPLATQVLLELGYDPSVDDNSAIREAARRGLTDTVRILISDPRVDPSANDNEAIIDASYYGDTEIVAMLLADPRVDPNEDRVLPLRRAIEGDHYHTVELLLSSPRVDASILGDLRRLITSRNNWKMIELLRRYSWGTRAASHQ